MAQADSTSGFSRNGGMRRKGFVVPALQDCHRPN